MCDLGVGRDTAQLWGTESLMIEIPASTAGVVRFQYYGCWDELHDTVAHIVPGSRYIAPSMVWEVRWSNVFQPDPRSWSARRGEKKIAM